MVIQTQSSNEIRQIGYRDISTNLFNNTTLGGVLRGLTKSPSLTYYVEADPVQ